MGWLIIFESLSPDLLHLIRINFLLDKDPPPYTAEADLLLSPLCQEIGENLYEMDPAVRELLLRDLVSHYGKERLREVATLLWQYSQGRSDWSGRPGLERAQQFTALNILDPAQARQWLSAAEAQAGQPDAPVDKEWFLAMERERTAAESAVQSEETPATPPIPEEAEANFSYEHGLANLADSLAGNDTRLADFNSYRQRLLDNLRTERRFGATEITRSERARIVSWLNTFALSAHGVSFLELCRIGQPETSMPVQTSSEERENIENSPKSHEVENSAQRDALLREAEALVQSGEYDEAQSLYRHNINLFRQLGDTVREAHALKDLASILHGAGNLAEAYHLTEQAAYIFDQLNDKLNYARALKQFALIRQSQGDLTSAQGFCEIALRQFQQLGDRFGESATLYELGTLFQQQGNVELARNRYGQALAISRAIGDRVGESRTLFQFAELARLEGDTTTARECYMRSIDIERQVKNSARLAEVLGQFGLLLQQQGEFTEARRVLENALAINQSLHGEQSSHTAISWNNLAALLRQQGDTDVARSYLERAIYVFEETLGPEHPTTRAARSNLASLDGKSEKPGEPTAKNIAHQQHLLEVHRRRLTELLQQRAELGSLHEPPEVALGISEVRDNIARIKRILRGWGIAVEDHPDDISSNLSDQVIKEQYQLLQTHRQTLLNLLQQLVLQGGLAHATPSLLDTIDQSTVAIGRIKEYLRVNGVTVDDQPYDEYSLGLNASQKQSKGFNSITWQGDVQNIIVDIAHNPRAALKRARTSSLYSLLLACTLPPLAAAYAAERGSAFAVLTSLAGDLSTQLLSNLVQGKYDSENVLAIAAQEAQEDELVPVYQKLAGELGVIPFAETILTTAGQTAALTQLRNEIRRRNALGRTDSLSISGKPRVGTAIAGDVVAGDKVGGDKVQGPTIEGHIRGKFADTSPKRTRELIDALTRRLNVLERQAAAFGINVRPDMTTEIDDIRKQITQLEALLDE